MIKDHQKRGYLVEIKPPSKGWINIDLEELWRYRELAFAFAARDIKVRYKQTLIGVCWVFIQPVATVVIFNFIFGTLAKIPSEGIPYPLFSFIGVSLWTYFSTSLGNASNSVIGSEGLIKKVYFPRLILPLSASLTPIIDLAIALVTFFAMMAYYKMVPGVSGLLLLPILMLIIFLFSSGLGMFFASLNLKFRDFRYALPFFTQILIYATPVIYPSSLLQGKYYFLLLLNPMTGVIEAARAGIFGQKEIDLKLLGLSFIISLIIFVFGAYNFKRVEKFFADIV